MQKIVLILEWVKSNWAELLTAAGLGTGGVVTGKSMIDKKQDKKIWDQGLAIHNMDDRLKTVESDQKDLKRDIETNTKFDQLFKEEVNKSLDKIEKKLDKSDEKQDAILDKIFEIVNK